MFFQPGSFFILTCVGLWRPIHWQGWKFYIYNLYTIIIVLTNFAFTLSEFLDLILVSSTVKEFTNNLSMMLAMVAACGKIIGILMNRKELINIMTLLQKKPFKLKNKEENDIQNKYNQFSRRQVTTKQTFSINPQRLIFRSYWLFLTVGVIGISLTGMMEAQLFITLPYRGWLPYNYTNRPIIYWLTTTQQLITFFIGCNVDIGFDTLFPSMMFYICAQVHILKHRFKVTLNQLSDSNIKYYDSEMLKISEKKLIGDWVEHHIDVLSFSDYVYDVFSKPVLLQYCLSSIILCATVYSLSSIPLFSIEFISSVVYIITTVLQIFLVCMSAHQVTLQFEDLNDSMYNTNWVAISNRAKKSMFMIVNKTYRPVIFTSGYIITLSLNSFKSVIKLSYSIFNVLQTS